MQGLQLSADLAPDTWPALHEILSRAILLMGLLLSKVADSLPSNVNLDTRCRYPKVGSPFVFTLMPARVGGVHPIAYGWPRAYVGSTMILPGVPDFQLILSLTSGDLDVR